MFFLFLVENGREGFGLESVNMKRQEADVGFFTAGEKHL